MRTFQGSDGRLLHHRRRIRRGLALQLTNLRDNWRRTKRISGSPSRHGIALRERADDYKVFPGFAHRSRRLSVAGEVQVDVAFVGDNVNPASMRHQKHLAHIVRIHYRARRIAGTVQNDGARARGNRALDHVGREPEIVIFVGFDVDAFSPRVLDDVLE